ncbi:MAG: NAD-dependent epimerase/dehydratase family protein, partial [Halobaculum sp.]
GHGGHGFWTHSPGVALENNVAAGHRHYGFGFWMRALIDRGVESVYCVDLELPGGGSRPDRRGWHPAVRFRTADLTDGGETADVIAETEPDGVVHLAALPNAINYPGSRTFDTNVTSA